MRNGRVVCLISKGQEERKHKEAENSIKTLWQALRNHKAFPFRKSAPLLPDQPELIRKNMQITTNYRLSQIGGYDERKEKKRYGFEKQTLIEDITWRLSGSQEHERWNLFGKYSGKYFTLKNSLKSWQQSIPLSHNMKSNGSGRSCEILREIEHMYLGNCNNVSERDLYEPNIEIIHAASDDYDDGQNGSVANQDMALSYPSDNDNVYSNTNHDFSPKETHTFSQCDQFESPKLSTPCVHVETSTSTKISERLTNKASTPSQYKMEKKLDNIFYSVAESQLKSSEEKASFTSDSSPSSPLKRSLSQHQIGSQIIEMIADNATPIQSPLKDANLCTDTTSKSTPKESLKANKRTTVDEDSATTETMAGDIPSIRSTHKGPILLYDNHRSVQEESIGFYNHKCSTKDNDAIPKHNNETWNRSNIFPNSVNENNCTSNNISTKDNDGISFCSPKLCINGSTTSNSPMKEKRIEIDLEVMPNSEDFASPIGNNDLNAESINKLHILEELKSDSKPTACCIDVDSENVEIDHTYNGVSGSDSPQRCDFNDVGYEEEKSQNDGDPQVQPLDQGKLKSDENARESLLSTFCFDLPSQLSSSSSSEDSDSESNISFTINLPRDKNESKDQPLQKEEKESAIIVTTNDFKVAHTLQQEKCDDEQDIIHCEESPSPVIANRKYPTKNNMVIMTQMHSQLSPTHTNVLTDTLDQMEGFHMDLTDTPNQVDGLSNHKQNNDLTNTPDKTINTAKNLFASTQKSGGSLVNQTSLVGKKKRKAKIDILAKGKRQKNSRTHCALLDLEAACSDSDSENETESDENDQGMSQDSFINNSSQLGYSQTQCLTQTNVITSHRRFDVLDEDQSLYSTPVFRRAHHMTQNSVPSSEKALGKMHFIKSVLEHHRKGGHCDEIEREFHSIAANSNNESQNSERDQLSGGIENHTQSTAISIEQRLRMERNKQKALMIRQDKLKQQSEK